MKNLCYFAMCSLFLLACQLSSDQEKALNQALGKYLDAWNDCKPTGLVGFTHPEYVKHVKAGGDSLFMKVFDCNNEELYYRLYDPTLKQISKDGDDIQVLYEFGSFGTIQDKQMKEHFQLIAWSQDDGKNWFFVPYRVYQDQLWGKSLNRRLLK